MANRTMQAKALKLKRQKRLFPKSYQADYIPVGKRANTVVLSEYSMRGKSVYNPYLERMFPGVIPKDNAPRKEVLQRIEQLLSNVPMERNIVLDDTEEQKVMLFFNITHTSWFFVWIDKTEHVMRKSIKFSSKSRALQVLRMQKITWIDKVILST